MAPNLSLSNKNNYLSILIWGHAQQLLDHVGFIGAKNKGKSDVCALQSKVQ